MKLRTFIREDEPVTIERVWSDYSALRNLWYVFADGRLRALFTYWKFDTFIYTIPKNISHIIFTKKEEYREDHCYWLFRDVKLPVMAELHMLNGETYIVSKEDGVKLASKFGVKVI